MPLFVQDELTPEERDESDRYDQHQGLDYPSSLSSWINWGRGFWLVAILLTIAAYALILRS